MRIVALVPMRDQSERVPGKNYRTLAGAPLFHHILRALQACRGIAEIAVDTDSPSIKAGLAEHFPAVRVIERPQHLRAGEVPMNEILLHDTAQIPADYYLQTHSTNPLLRSETIDQAIDAFVQALPRVDSLFSVTGLQTRFYDAHGKAVNHNPKELLRTQDLPPIFEENSCIYIFSRASLAEHAHRIGSSPLMFPIPRNEAWDIDEELDFQIADFLMQQRQKNS
ncbi:MAG: acylneuraminate cytidylyltransferase family protein [Anaerolineales bacterium]|nr:MAG: acylneuraminate cytidylyltransferase family protein [Anaerolineales bacterium]